MVAEGYSLSTVLIAFERTLHIEYDVESVSGIISNSELRLRDEIGVDINGDLSALLKEARTETIREVVESLYLNLQEHLKALSLIYAVGIFRKEFPFHLRQVSWLGLEKTQCLVEFQYLISKDTYSEKGAFFPRLIASADHLTTGDIKRLLTIMGALDRIGVTEGVSIIAQYIYASSAYIV